MTWRTIATALVFAVTAFAACTGVDDIRSGMSESELIARLGSPDQRVEEEHIIKLYSTGRGCSTDVNQVLIYKRLIAEDILVGLSPDRRVRCAWDAAVFEFID
jgi:hypothetical protein